MSSVPEPLSVRAAAFRKDVIEPVLANLSEASGRELGGEDAVELLLFTALHESGGLQFRRQLGGGPALGLYQMEPATHDDIWMHYLSNREDLDAAMRLLFTPAGGSIEAAQLEEDDGYATAMARIHYLRARQELPKAGDAEGQAAYWKRHYNTVLGRGTTLAFLESRQRSLSA